MNIKILELTEKKVRMHLEGEGHTFMNALVSEILEDPAVDVAKYKLEFEFSDPELLVTTKDGKKPLLVIDEACCRISGYCDEIMNSISDIKE